ncbi:hypothetical protein EVAR_11658_1 [Eumeta japonica]|uniref:Uncharacterized protein n=1 Tax=Eumeta variegata TaxID=151549 RepID=A0A4C1U4F0_EUMVA|nr:hypothetical protein EVAR_11658_1 [Eumeta japonica]
MSGGCEVNALVGRRRIRKFLGETTKIFAERAEEWGKRDGNGDGQNVRNGGIRTYASQEIGALDRRLGPLGHATI